MRCATLYSSISSAHRACRSISPRRHAVAPPFSAHARRSPTLLNRRSGGGVCRARKSEVPGHFRRDGRVAPPVAALRQAPDEARGRLRRSVDGEEHRQVRLVLRRWYMVRSVGVAAGRGVVDDGREEEEQERGVAPHRHVGPGRHNNHCSGDSISSSERLTT